MIVEHLSENDIQQYVSDPSACGSQVARHIETCEICQVKAETYQVLFSGIRHQPQPVFDFNLSDLVLSQLERPKPKFSWEIMMVYLFSVVGITAILVLCLLLREYFTSLFAGSSTLVFYLFVVIASTSLVFQGIEIYRNYQKKINALNIS